jgi:hypothetical protein
VRHRTVVIRALDKCTVQVLCECGWHSGVFGAVEVAATMNALHRASGAQDLHGGRRAALSSDGQIRTADGLWLGDCFAE